jgi:hypothetical protein
MSESNPTARRLRLAYVALAVLTLAVVALAGLWLWPRHAVNPTPAPSPPAPKRPAQEERVSFVIQSAGKSKDGRLVFLNDQRDWRAPGVFTVVIDAEAVPEYAGVQPRSLVGKTVEATGVVGQYQGRPELWVRDAAKLTVK